MDDECRSSDLSKTERCLKDNYEVNCIANKGQYITYHQPGGKSVCADRLGREHKIFPLAKFFINIIGIPVSWNDTREYCLT